MGRTPRDAQPDTVTEHTRVGNLGCIRFPLSVRKASGVKRGDRLTVSVQGPHRILLTKVPDGVPDEMVIVEQCACQAPEACHLPADLVTVGWSYVQLEHGLARKLGFLPERPLKLVGEPAMITVSIVQSRGEAAKLPLVKCPP